MPVARACAAILLAIVALTGCTGSPVPATVPPQTERTDEPPGGVGPLPLERLEFALVPVAEGFTRPVLVTHAGDGSGRIFVVEQDGLVRVTRNGTVSRDPFLDVRRLVTAGGERGLLGLAFAPDFRSSGRFYVNYTDTRGDTVVARFVAADPESDTPVTSGPDILLRVEQPYANHNGGHLAFGPEGYLWIGMGDGGSGGDPQGHAQDQASLLGKMLMMNVTASSPKPKIAVSGVRNPWRFSFDRKTGDLWIADVGQNAREEINVLPAGRIAGANLGWNLFEGSQPYPEGRAAKGDIDAFVMPVAEYRHDEGRSITGGYVYRGSRYPRMAGAYLYADFETGWVAALRTTETSAAEPPSVTEQRIVVTGAGLPSSFGEDEEGEVYLCDYRSGTVWAISAR